MNCMMHLTTVFFHRTFVLIEGMGAANHS